MIKEMNVATDASNEYNQQHLNHFEMAHADQDCESYMPIKRNSEQPQVEHTSVDLESFDMTRLVTSTYLANYFLSQSNQVTLGIHFPMEYDKTDDMMLLNTPPLSLNIDTTLSADVIMNEWELAIDDMKANGQVS